MLYKCRNEPAAQVQTVSGISWFYLQKQALSSVAWAEEGKQNLLSLAMIKCTPGTSQNLVFAVTGCLLQKMLSCRVSNYVLSKNEAKLALTQLFNSQNDRMVWVGSDL